MSRIECSQTGDWYSLFHDVNEMATILSAHAESQKQTKEFLQDIISDVSHQIKTPLSALKMYHEIISSHKGEAETVANFSEKSQREIKRMENVIYTLLKLARLDAGIIQMEKAEENVSALMQDVLERFETWAEQDHKEITLSGTPVDSDRHYRRWQRHPPRGLIQHFQTLLPQPLFVRCAWDRIGLTAG